MNPDDMNPDDMNDNLGARLRRALMAEADMVNPAGDGLGRIRTVIDERRQRAWWRHPAVALAAAAVLGVAVAAGVYGLNDGGGDDELVAATPTTTSTASESPTSPAASPEPSATSSAEPTSSTASPSEAPAGTPVSLPVYYVHDDGTGVRLYREFHAVPLIGGDRVRTALTEMFRGRPNDPDYLSLWSKDTKVNKVTKQGDTASIDLNAAATKATDVGSGSARATLQQLVYTVTAADPAVKKVTLRVEGRVVPELWGHVAVGTKAFTRAPAVDVQGLIWLLSPKEGEKVGRTVEIKGYGTAFEGTISWEVRGAGGKVVAEGFTQGGSNGQFAEFADRVTLRPGTYTIRAFESSAEDGRPLHVDDKRFTVE